MRRLHLPVLHRPVPQRPGRHHRLAAGALCAGVAAVVLAACSGSTASKAPSSTTGPLATTTTTAPRTATTAPAQIPTSLYFVRGSDLGVSQRMISAGSDPKYATMLALLAGPNGSETAVGLGTQIPPGTTLRGLEIRGGIATINLSPQFISPGPPDAMAARLAQIVYTLTAYPNVGRVAIQVSKFPLTTFAGVNMSTPVGRTQVTAALPDVLLESPAVGSTVHGSTVSLSGLTSFVGTFDIQLLDSSGRLLAATTNTAVNGATFTQTLPVRSAPAGVGTLQVYARPATGGQPTQATSFPVPIQP